jgi:putative DNA primase/helicase
MIRGAQKDDPLGLGAGPEEPRPVRYRTNDSSYEAIGELLVSNPTGILVERDELVSLLKHLDREEQCVARGFYLSGWSGQQPYTFDRIGRGHIHVESVCIGVLGNTQPTKIAEYVRRANADGAGGDGLIQRFGLLVWPDEPVGWKNVDEWPNAESRDAVWRIFDRISKLTETEVLKLGALKGKYDKVPFFRFGEEAAVEFLDWRRGLEGRLRSDELSPALEGHLAKYRKLVPALALIDHVAEGGMGNVGAEALARALDMAEYLETHVRRVYGATDAVDIIAAEAILAHIRRGDLKDGFTVREVHHKNWSRLTDCNHVQRGIDLLVELDHLAADASDAKPAGGRPKVSYRINPARK